MRLLRVEVPKFRALENVVIDFEPDFTPQVFPLGSLNGGGKSTLLQLIFVLLNYVGNLHPYSQASEHQQYLTQLHQQFLINMLAELKINDNKTIYSLATITLLFNNQNVTLEFLYGDNNILHGKDDFFRTYPNENIVFYCLINSKSVASHQFLILKQEIAKKLFLISPSNHPYLFLLREERRALFSSDSKQIIYDSIIKSLQSRLPNFFTFDFVDVLVEVFRRARARDFKERNKENPFFHTEKLEADINNLFIDGKKITSLIIEQQRHTQDEIQGVFFKLPSGQEIYPEDLSHGELKRLAIFVLIKYHEIHDAIVLIDEIENGFHPRWQRYIVDDLVEWGATNQYILATHSYEVCRNLTFEHIKELAPKLMPEPME
jgi:predicted ATPase